MYLIQGRLAVALGFSTAAHVGLAWMVNGQLSSNAAPAQRALTVAMTPAAPRAVLNSISPQATPALSPAVVRALLPPIVEAIAEPDAVVAVEIARVDEISHVPLVASHGPEQLIRARDAPPAKLALAIAPSQMPITKALQRETIDKALPSRRQTAPAASRKRPASQTARSATASPAREPAHAQRGSGTDAGSPQAVAGQPGAVREAMPASGNEPPEYPWTARARGHQGRVVLSVWVSAEGEADRLAVLHSSGYPTLDRAAVEAVEQWRFEPARRGGLETGSLLYVPVVFRLEDEG